MSKVVPIRTNVYKRKTPSGNVRWMVRWRAPDTHQWKAITGGRTKDEALIIEAQVRQDLLKGLDPTPRQKEIMEDPVLSSIIDLFYVDPIYLSGNQRWRKEAKGKIDRQILPQLGSKRMSKLDSKTVHSFYLKLQDLGLSNTTIHKYHTVLCQIGDVYKQSHHGRENPFRKLEDLKKRFPEQSPTRDINFLTEEELDLLFRETDKSRSGLLSSFVRFLANTGLRRSEALNLKWTDIDEKGGFIHVRKSKNGSARIIPLESAALRALASLNRKSEYVFMRKNGQRPDKDSFLKPLQRAARRAQIQKRIDIHTLRHSYGSNKLRGGWGLKKVSMMLGHSDVQITAEIYTHLLDGDLKVRDEFHFDNKVDVENSDVQELNEENLVKTLKGFFTALQKTPCSETRFAEIAALAASIDNEQLDSTMTAETGTFATRMLHAKGRVTDQVSSESLLGKEFSRVIQDLASASKWRTREDSNLRPSAPEADALSN